MGTTRTVRRSLAAFAALSLVVPAAPASGQSTELTIVVNQANPTLELTREDLARIFLKRQTRWAHGVPIVAMDQSESTNVRERFSRAVHDRSAVAIRAFWQQQVFSGREIPPVEKGGDADVLRAVAETAGAIGYVPAGTPLPPGVRAITVVWS